MIHSLAPVWDRRARVLILGSMPGADSLRLQQYYAHPRNAFWSIISDLLGISEEITYAQRLVALRSRGIALWDVLASCEREGSLDSGIQRNSEAPNPIPGLLERLDRPRMIVLNGRKAESSFERFLAPAIHARWPRLAILVMPSTSPAHAALRTVDKRRIWSRMLDALDTAGKESRSMAKKKIAATKPKATAKKAAKKPAKKVAAKPAPKAVRKPTAKKVPKKASVKKAAKPAAKKATRPAIKKPAKKMAKGAGTKTGIVKKRTTPVAKGRKAATKPAIKAVKKAAIKKASAARPTQSKAAAVVRKPAAKPAKKAPLKARKPAVVAPTKTPKPQPVQRTARAQPAAKSAPVAAPKKLTPAKPKRVSAPRVPPTPKRGGPKSRAVSTNPADKVSLYKQPLHKPEPWQFGGRLPHEHAFAGVKAQPDAERLAGKSRKVH